MRVGMPHLGNLYLGIRAMAKRLGGELIVPPACNQRALSLGVKYSPEGLCIPFKLMLGNMIEAAEMGADTMLMVSGFGICRLGYYARAQKQILRELGYDIELVQFGVSEKKLAGFLQTIKRLAGEASWLEVILAFRFGMAKLKAADGLERLVQKVRAVEEVKGTASSLLAQAVQEIDQADDYDTLKRVRRQYAERLNQVPRDSRVRPLVVGITGEFYVMLEPFSNLDVEKELGKLGVVVRRRTFISDWVKYSLFLNPLGIDETRKIHRAAFPYLKRDVGGDGWESVGEKVLHAREYDGIVHLAPFTCMPEIVAQNIMPSTRENIPVLTILCDEQLAKPGVLTRLEAFVDLLERRRRARAGRQLAGVRR
jgi:predicted nucleotide-binding protein (sugar kinase/HSP70/actin superfamily)